MTADYTTDSQGQTRRNRFDPWLASQEEYKSHKSGKTARSIFGTREQDAFLRGYLEDLEEDHLHDNKPGHEDWRNPDELDDD